MIPFFASGLALSLPCIPTCEGTHWKATVLPNLLRSFIVLLASLTVWVVACLFEATGRFGVHKEDSLFESHWSKE